MAPSTLPGRLLPPETYLPATPDNALATSGQRGALIQLRIEIPQMHQLCANHRDRVSPQLVTP